MGSIIRIVLAEDQTLVRRGIRGLLDLTDDLRVVAEAADGDEAYRAIAEHRPDVALLDVRMPLATGVEVLERARAAGIAPPTLLLTTFDDDEVLRDGIAAGIAGFLLKDVDFDELADGIRAVAAGRTLLRPAVTAHARQSVKASGLAFDALERPDPLTAREVDVLRLIAAGMSNREIADSLGLTEGTVKNHTSSILSKFGVRDRTRAVLKAIERGDL